jgi:hypothetical protein
LELSTTESAPGNGSGIVVGSTVWIVSPPIPIEEGQLIEITGWVRVEEPVTGSLDGLQIIDTLGGAELTLAVRQTNGWQPFQMLRGVPQSGALRLTFALDGVGTAHVDSVMVRSLTKRSLRRLPPTSTADGTGPLLISPTR